MEPREAHFPGGPVVRIHLPIQGIQVRPVVGELRFPRATEQLSLCTATTEPAGSRARALQQEKPSHTTTREPPRDATKTQCSQNNFKKMNKKGEAGEKNQNLSPKLCHHPDNDQYPCHSRLSPQGTSLSPELLLDCPPWRNCRQRVQGMFSSKQRDLLLRARSLTAPTGPRGSASRVPTFKEAKRRDEITVS